MRFANPARTAGCLAAVSLALGACGARTGLPVDGANGGGGAAATEPPKACIPGTFDLEKAISTVMFVIDRSGSMGQKLTVQGAASKWELMREGLAATLPSVDEEVQMGLLLFPSLGSGFGQESCAVPGAAELLPALGHASAIDALLQSNSPGGLTPTASAIQAAAATLKATRAASSARAIVLATDGGPNCNPALDPDTCQCVVGGKGGCKLPTNCLDDQRTTGVIGIVAASGIPTYVIGLGSDLQAQFGDTLDAMAIAGGRPKQGSTAYYAVTSQQDLSAALTDVRDQVARCVYLSSSVPDDTGTIEVDLGGVPIPIDPTGQTGWSWVDKNNGELVFSSAACAKVGESKTPPTVTVTCGASATSSSSSSSGSSSSGTASSGGTGMGSAGVGSSGSGL